jgi:hypothetical protein
MPLACADVEAFTMRILPPVSVLLVLPAFMRIEPAPLLPDACILTLPASPLVVDPVAITVFPVLEALPDAIETLPETDAVNVSIVT